jgi:hypothetical protein
MFIASIICSRRSHAHLCMRSVSHTTRNTRTAMRFDNYHEGSQDKGTLMYGPPARPIEVTTPHPL